MHFEKSRLLTYPVGRIRALRAGETSSGTCYFVRSPRGELHAVTAAHVLEGADSAQITKVANAAGTIVECLYAIDLEDVVGPNGDDEPDLCLLPVADLEVTLIQGGFTDGPIEVEVPEDTSADEIREYRYCSYVRTITGIEVLIRTGETGVISIDGRKATSVRVDQLGEFAFLADAIPPNGASGSSVFTINQSERARFVGTLTSGCEGSVEKVDASWATIVPASAIHDLFAWGESG
jgi:hypothetical protein